MKTIPYHSVASLACFSGLLLLVVASSSAAQSSNIIARAGGNVTLKAPGLNVKSTAGAGGTAAHASVGGNNKQARATQDPAARGGKFDDLTNIGPIAPAPPSYALTPVQTALIGRSLGTGYSGLGTGGAADAKLPRKPGDQNPLGATDLVNGRSVLYNVNADADKVAAAKASPNKTLTMQSNAGKIEVATTDAQAMATQTVAVNPDMKSVNVTGKAEVKIEYERVNPLNGVVTPRENAFAAAAVNDPITYALDSLGANGEVDVSVGDSLDPLFLQSSDPGGHATAFFELGINGENLLEFDLTLNFFTSNKAQALNVDFISPQLGSEDAFRSYFLNNLVFDSSAHSLGALDAILLYTVPVTPQSGPQTISFIYGSTGSAATPESGSITLIAASVMLGMTMVKAMDNRRNRFPGAGVVSLLAIRRRQGRQLASFFLIVSFCVETEMIAQAKEPVPAFTIKDKTSSFTLSATPNAPTQLPASAEWEVGGKGNPNQAFQAWWWYRLPTDNRESAINGNFNWTVNGNTAQATFDLGPNLPSTMQWTIMGPGDGAGFLQSFLSVKNTGANAVDLTVFNYLDLDLGGTKKDDASILNQGKTALIISDPTWLARYSPSPQYSAYASDGFSKIRDLLTNSEVNDFENKESQLAAGDWTGGFEWTRKIAPGGTASFAADVELNARSVPESGTFSLPFIGLAMLVLFHCAIGREPEPLPANGQRDNLQKQGARRVTFAPS